MYFSFLILLFHLLFGDARLLSWHRRLMILHNFKWSVMRVFCLAAIPVCCYHWVFLRLQYLVNIESYGMLACSLRPSLHTDRLCSKCSGCWEDVLGTELLDGCWLLAEVVPPSPNLVSLTVKPGFTTFFLVCVANEMKPSHSTSMYIPWLLHRHVAWPQWSSSGIVSLLVLF